MAPLEVDSVQLAALDPDVLLGRNFDHPKPGQPMKGGPILLVGWVLGRSEPALAVEVVTEGRVVSRVPVNVPRPDLALAFPEVEGVAAGGFRAPVTVVDAGSVLDLQVRAVLSDQRRVPLGTFRLKRAGAGATSPDERVSVIIPCYNQAHYLGDALASIAAQTHGQPEVIVVDDGSTDNAVEVAKRYPGVRYVRQDNGGLAAARNTGIRHSTGDRLVFLDADDRLLPSALRVGLTGLAARPGHAFVYGRWRLIGADGSVLPTSDQGQVDDDPYRELLRMCFISTPAAVMYRRAAVIAAGGFDTTVSPSADYDLYLRLTRRWPVSCHGELVAEYRRHGANMTLDRGMMLDAELTVLHRQWPHVSHDPDLVRAYREGLRRSQEYHGGRLARDVRALAATGRWEPALRGGLRLVRHHPAALVPAGQGLAEAASEVAVRLRSTTLARLGRSRDSLVDSDDVEEDEVATEDEVLWER